MKLSIFLLLSSIFIGVLPIDSPSDFNNKLNSIARDLNNVIMKPDECNSLHYRAEAVEDEIEKALSNKDEYTKEEIIELKSLLKESEALQDYISIVALGKNGTFDLSDLYRANKRVGATISTVSTGKFCVDVITISIGNHITYLLQNKTNTDYNLSYKYKLKNGLELGRGTMTVVQKAVRPIYTNNEKPSQKSILVYGITCKELKH